MKIIKNFSVLPVIATVLLLAGYGYAAQCETNDQMLSRTEQFQRAAEDFKMMVKPGATGFGPSYSSVANTAPELVRKSMELRRTVSQGAACETISEQLASLSRSLSFVDRSLQDTQYQFGNSALIMSWKNVENAYSGLKHSIR
jgi:hypothetical protein